MLPYEFLSDRYANLFLSHNFGPLLLKLKNFQPDISVHHNMSWGSLNNTSRLQNNSYHTKEKVFFENGLQFDNILKLNFQNLGYLGAGLGIFYRYGAYSSSSLEENIAYKFSLRYSIK